MKFLKLEKPARADPAPRASTEDNAPPPYAAEAPTEPQRPPSPAPTYRSTVSKAPTYRSTLSVRPGVKSLFSSRSAREPLLGSLSEEAPSPEATSSSPRPPDPFLAALPFASDIPPAPDSSPVLSIPATAPSKSLLNFSRSPNCAHRARFSRCLARTRRPNYAGSAHCDEHSCAITSMARHVEMRPKGGWGLSCYAPKRDLAHPDRGMPGFVESPFCAAHACPRPGCVARKCETEAFCPEHTCIWIRQGNASGWLEAQYCDNHVCVSETLAGRNALMPAKKGSGKCGLRRDGAPWICSEHECRGCDYLSTPGLSRADADAGNVVCASCICVFPRCWNRAVKKGRTPDGGYEGPVTRKDYLGPRSRGSETERAKHCAKHTCRAALCLAPVSDLTDTAEWIALATMKKNPYSPWCKDHSCSFGACALGSGWRLKRPEVGVKEAFRERIRRNGFRTFAKFSNGRPCEWHVCLAEGCTREMVGPAMYYTAEMVMKHRKKRGYCAKHMGH